MLARLLLCICFAGCFLKAAQGAPQGEVSDGQKSEIPESATNATIPEDVQPTTENVGESDSNTTPSPGESPPVKDPAAPVSADTDNSSTTDGPKEAPKTSSLYDDLSVPLDASKKIPAAVVNASSQIAGKLSDQIRVILKHFQNPQEVALPGDVIIPDPMDVPDMSGTLGISDGNFTNITVHEQSKFTIDSVNTNLDDMQIYVSLKMKRIVILGNYTMSTVFVGTSEGPFNVTLSNVLSEGTIYLARDSNGRIFANRSVTNMVQQGIHAHFVNSTGMYQGIINLAATFLFIGIKPYILNKIDEKLCKDINERLSQVAFRLPEQPWSPVDLAILEGRRYVRKMGYDPLIIKDIFKYDQDYLTVSIDKFTVKGLSKFSRVGNVTLQMENNTVQFGVRIITSKLEGSLDWFYDFGKIGITRNGSSTFTVTRIQIYAVVSQSVDIRKKPVLESLDIETGPIYVKMDGEGSFDYVVEFVVMLLPKMIRHMIVDSLEVPIKHKVQEILDNINVEKIVDENLDDVERLIQNFRLSY